MKIENYRFLKGPELFCWYTKYSKNNLVDVTGKSWYEKWFKFFIVSANKKRKHPLRMMAKHMEEQQILPRFARSSFPFPSPSDACHIGWVKYCYSSTSKFPARISYSSSLASRLTFESGSRAVKRKAIQREEVWCRGATLWSRGLAALTITHSRLHRARLCSNVSLHAG